MTDWRIIMNTTIQKLKEQIELVIRGKSDIIERVLCAVISGGHILLEDIPGVGKTTLALALSRTMSLSYKRMQFTPDVLPSDLSGFSMFDRQKNDFVFKEGSVFTQLFLADEINRTSPKTQSALLEVMEEGRVTIDSVTRELPEPFIVIATQNPLGSSGTQKLPESQLDRFMARLSMGYPDHENAIDILKGKSGVAINTISQILSAEELILIRQHVAEIHVSNELYDYIVTLTEATRNPEIFSLGLSPRGSIALLNMAKGWAYINGRSFLLPEDIHDVFNCVACHRVQLNSKSRAAGLTLEAAFEEILKNTPLPKLN